MAIVILWTPIGFQWLVLRRVPVLRFGVIFFFCFKSIAVSSIFLTALLWAKNFNPAIWNSKYLKNLKEQD